MHSCHVCLTCKGVFYLKTPKTHKHTLTTVSNLRPTPPTHSVNVLIRGFIMTHILTIKQHLETPPETLSHSVCVWTSVFERTLTERPQKAL